MTNTARLLEQTAPKLLLAVQLMMLGRACDRRQTC
jgi:hypothetical protein